MQEAPDVDPEARQMVDRPFDNAGDDELEHVNDDQTEQSGQDLGSIGKCGEGALLEIKRAAKNHDNEIKAGFG